MTEQAQGGDTAQIIMPPKLIPCFEGEARYRGSYGGRGSGKTRTFAKMAAVKGYQLGMNGIGGQIICGRQFQNSLDDSSFQEVKIAIQEEPWLAEYYDCGERYIRSKDGNISFTFVGLARNINSVKSVARILLCWVDEAEAVSEKAWQTLIPSVREDDSEIWVTWNPEQKNSPTDSRFRKNQTGDMKIVELNYRDNPMFPQVLELERLNDRRLRPDDYEHIWEGDYKTYAQGAYYLTEMRTAKEQDRISKVPYDPALGTVTAWDLGMSDSTAIWFAQYVGQEIRIIDYYEAEGMALDHYVSVLNAKPYNIIQSVLPHDVEVRELGTGKSRKEVLRALGLDNITVAPQLRVDDGIQAVRAMLNKCWFDAVKCERGIECLRQYRREYNEERQVWQGKPLHDWASHGADAFRYLATGRKSTSSWDKPIKRNLRGVA